MAARMESAESRRLRVVNSHLHSEPSGNLLHTRSMLGRWGISSFFSNAPKISIVAGMVCVLYCSFSDSNMATTILFFQQCLYEYRSIGCISSKTKRKCL
jgi:hypothetical protein